MRIPQKRSVRITFVALMAAALVASCGGGGAPVSSPSSNPPATTATGASATAGSAAKLEVTVNTSSTDCNPNKTAGDCYLPIYAKPTYETGTIVLNLSPDAAAKPAEVKPGEGVYCKRDDQAGCWPQPSTKLTPQCVTTVDGVRWIGVQFPYDKLLADPKPDPATTWSNLAEGWLLGFQKAEFLEGSGIELQACATQR